MPEFKGNKIGITVFIDPETFRIMEDTRNPYISRSAYAAMALEEVFGAYKRGKSC